MKTNCDLYRSIVAISKTHSDSSRSLEEYLRAMLPVASKFADQDNLSLQEFHDTLAHAHTQPALPFDEVWRDTYDRLKKDDDREDHVGWYSLIIRQIVDLDEMRTAGRLEDEYRYFGIDSPRGNRWFNFDPATYLECAMACMFNGRDCDEPSNQADIETIEEVTWDDFKWFLYWGQSYE